MNGNRFAVVKRKCKQEKTRHFKPSQVKHKKERKKNQDEIVHTGCKMNY